MQGCPAGRKSSQRYTRSVNFAFSLRFCTFRLHPSSFSHERPRPDRRHQPERQVPLAPTRASRRRQGSAQSGVHRLVPRPEPETKTRLPFGGSAAGWSDPNVARVRAQTTAATHLLFAVPVYNYDVNAVAKNFVELMGEDALGGKTVGFLVSAGGHGFVYVGHGVRQLADARFPLLDRAALPVRRPRIWKTGSSPLNVGRTPGRVAQRTCSAARRPSRNDRREAAIGCTFSFVQKPCSVINFHAMSLQELERAVQTLPSSEFEEFSDWFDEWRTEQWDRQIEQDALAGKLDHLAEEALADFRAREVYPRCRDPLCCRCLLAALPGIAPGSAPTSRQELRVTTLSPAPRFLATQTRRPLLVCPLGVRSPVAGGTSRRWAAVVLDRSSRRLRAHPQILLTDTSRKLQSPLPLPAAPVPLSPSQARQSRITSRQQRQPTFQIPHRFILLCAESSDTS